MHLAQFIGLAAKVLPRARYLKVLLSHDGGSAESRATVRIKCPYEANSESTMIFEELVRDQHYLKDICPPVTAHVLWRTALRHRFVAEIPYSTKLHSWLVVEFAVDQLGRRRNDRAVIVTRGQQPLAVWEAKTELTDSSRRVFRGMGSRGQFATESVESSSGY